MALLTKIRPIIGRPIPLGRRGEHLARRIDFGDLIELFTDAYDGGRPELRYQRPGDTTAYVPSSVDTTGDGLVWLPTNTDTAHPGTGRVELRWNVGGALAKSRTWDVVIEDSLVVDGDDPSDIDYYAGAYVVTPSWMRQALETRDKMCIDDIKVEPIQVQKVSNESGGVTLSI